MESQKGGIRMQASTCQVLVIGVIIFKAKKGWISGCGLFV